MKYYKIENNQFVGFFDKEIHKDIIFESDNLKSEYTELSEEKWQELLNAQSQGKAIVLENGELIAKKIVITLSDEEKLSNLRTQIVNVTAEINKINSAGFGDSELEEEKSKLIHDHMKLSEKIAYKELKTKNKTKTKKKRKS